MPPLVEASSAQLVGVLWLLPVQRELAEPREESSLTQLQTYPLPLMSLAEEPVHL